MTSFRFAFPVNKTYRDSATHPITLRRKYYGTLDRHISRDHFDVDVVGGGRRIKAWIYRGTAGFGPYYQLRMSNHEFAKLPDSCVRTRRLSVQVEFDGESGEVRLDPVA